MNEEKFKLLFEERKNAGASSSLLMQLRFSFELGAPDEIYPLLIRTEDFETREWMRLSFLEGMPASLVGTYPEMDPGQIKESRRRYFLAKEGVQDLKDTGEEVNRKLQKLQLLVEKSEPMEKFLNVILKQKDALIDNFQRQAAQMQEQNARMAGQLKEKDARIQELLADSQRAEGREDRPEEAEGTVEEPDPTCVKHRWPFRRRKGDSIAEYLKNPEWVPEQMAFVIECASQGMKLEDIKRVSAPSLSVERMKLLKKALELNERNG